MKRMIKTPICDFVRDYAQSESLRLHMPGHKGKDFLGIERFDITEIDGADVLYNSNGIIRESESIASELFETARTVYSTEGSSLCIRAMLYLAVMHGKTTCKKRPIIAAGRNAHKVFMTSSALLDFDIHWIFPDSDENGIVSCIFSPESLDKELFEMEQKPCAVYVTSPDYLGNIADISGIAEVCEKHGVLLLVDNAHGAYLKFLPDGKRMHPMDCGAHMCCDSAHKTLSVLTGGAYLHISPNAPNSLCDIAEKAMSLFASTSPSYLIMQSLDLANEYISSDSYSKKLETCCEAVLCLKQSLSEVGYKLVGDEPLKLTIAPKTFGYTGEDIYSILLSNGIVCEFSDHDYVVMMFTPENDALSFEKVRNALTKLEKKNAILYSSPELGIPNRIISSREAIFSESEIVKTKNCVGRILSSANVSCPPAIPIVVCGEMIDEKAVKVLEYYGIDECDVIK